MRLYRSMGGGSVALCTSFTFYIYWWPFYTRTRRNTCVICIYIIYIYRIHKCNDNYHCVMQTNIFYIRTTCIIVHIYMGWTLNIYKAVFVWGWSSAPIWRLGRIIVKWMCERWDVSIQISMYVFSCFINYTNFKVT